jgi:hypothetical protein
MRPPVMIEIFVLSEERMVPKSVAPQGNLFWITYQNDTKTAKTLERNTYLHFPSRVT